MHLEFTCSELTAKENTTRTMCQTSKLTSKTPEQCLMLLCLTCTLLHFAHYYIVIIAEFEQINAGWVREIEVSDNKFVFSNCVIYNVLWGGKI